MTVNIIEMAKEFWNDEEEDNYLEDCWTSYEIQKHSGPEGNYKIRCSTNDETDSGFPGSVFVFVLYTETIEQALEITNGGSHKGWTGCRVDVTLFGERI